jgi:glucose-6-phosphate-specific signal transduction histidine kinase
MDKRRLWVVLLSIIGLLAMIIGALDPLEGAFIILPGSGLIALGAFLSQSHHRRFIYWAFGLTAFGVAALIAMSLLGGVGGDTGRSTWWLLTALPYPVGWIMSLVGAVHLLISSLRKPSSDMLKSHY